MGRRAPGSSQEDEEQPTPPESPPMERRLNLSPLQRWGVPLLTLLPLLAVLGPLDVGTESVSAQDGALELEVSYPTRLRRGPTMPLTITLLNSGATPAPDVVVALDLEYAEAFLPLSSQPSPTSVDGDAYLVALGDVPPGGSRLVVFELTPGRYGRVAGGVEVTAGPERAPLRVSLATFVFP